MGTSYFSKQAMGHENLWGGISCTKDRVLVLPLRFRGLKEVLVFPRVLCLKRSKADAFTLPFRLWSQKKKTRIVFRIGTSYGGKKIQATPTKLNLGTS